LFIAIPFARLTRRDPPHIVDRTVCL